jgi:cytochrome c oxidase subunit II
MEISQIRRQLMSARMLVFNWIAAIVFTKQKERVIKVSVKKFEFIPSEICLTKGVPVVLELTSQDVLMGFSAPDFNLRSLIIPNRVMKVNLVPDKVGTYPFICDVFGGHRREDMRGNIIVS